MNPRAVGVVGLFAIALSGCGNHAGIDAAAQAATGQVDRNVAIGELVRDYQQARAAKQWDLALSYADRLQKLAPDSPQASSVKDTLTDTNLRAEMAHDKSRLATLWSYNVIASTGTDNDGAMITASIAEDSKLDTAYAEPARLIMRNHPKWGRSVGVVLGDGKFDCASKCQVSVQFDDQPARQFAASVAAQNPQGLNIDDEQTIRDSIDKIRVLTIATSVNGKPRSLSFPVGGFDRVALERKMP